MFDFIPHAIWAFSILISLRIICETVEKISKNPATENRNDKLEKVMSDWKYELINNRDDLKAMIQDVEELKQKMNSVMVKLGFTMK